MSGLQYKDFLAAFENKGCCENDTTYFAWSNYQAHNWFYYDKPNSHREETYTMVFWKNDEVSGEVEIENLERYFIDTLIPTTEECALFELEYGVEYLIKPKEVI